MDETPTPDPPADEPQESAADEKRIDEASEESFPASDPPSFWAGEDSPNAPGATPDRRRARS